MSDPPIHSATTVGPVRLNVADIERVRGFYERVLGLRTLEHGGDTLSLGPDGANPLVELVGLPEAPPRPRGRTGLFHLAILLSSRVELARAVRRMAKARWPLSGVADHLVSEAVYLSDPEGNGIEVYRDRPREDWRYVGGELEMATLPLDLDGVLRELTDADEDRDGMPAGARIGHVHLQVADLAAAEAFYHGVLGFEVTVRGYPGALFMSAGGYHHHIGVNTWLSEAAPAPEPGSRGLRWFRVTVPSPEELDRLAARVRTGGHEAQQYGDDLLTADPAGNRVLLSHSTA